MSEEHRDIELSIVIPCLDESETLATCIRKAQECIRKHGLVAEVVIADNGSTDGSQKIAVAEGARVVDVKEKGYGNALRSGIEAAAGRFVIMADADDSYDFSEFYPFVEALRDGADLVMGSRFRGKIMPGAMPWKNRVIGNPIQTALGRMMFHCPVSDFNCGMRGFTKEAYNRMGLVTTTWEFASEMVIKATLARMKIVEVPIVLSKDGRSRRPHLEPWRAGWRNVRFMLLHSPKWLFLVPGLSLLLFGLLGFVLLTPGPVRVGRTVLDVQTLIVCSAAWLVGFQVLCFGVLARTYAIAEGLLPPSRKATWLRRHFSLEKSLVAGVLMALAGVILLVAAFVFWSEASFGPLLDFKQTMRMIIVATTLIATGIQTGFTAFFMSVLEMKKKQ